MRNKENTNMGAEELKTFKNASNHGTQIIAVQVILHFQRLLRIGLICIQTVNTNLIRHRR